MMERRVHKQLIAQQSIKISIRHGHLTLIVHGYMVMASPGLAIMEDNGFLLIGRSIWVT